MTKSTPELLPEQAARTPLPWDWFHDAGCGLPCIYGPDDAAVAMLDPWTSEEDKDGIAEADAAFIVRACNSHYELLEACSAWIDWLKPDTPWREDAADYETRMLDAMRAAIAKATGAA